VQSCWVNLAVILVQNKIIPTSSNELRKWLNLLNSDFIRGTSDLLVKILYHLFNKLVHINKFLY